IRCACVLGGGWEKYESEERFRMMVEEMTHGVMCVFPILLHVCVISGRGKDYAKTVKNQSKPGNFRHKIGSLHQKLDQRAFFYNNRANEAKCQKIESSRYIEVSEIAEQAKRGDDIASVLMLENDSLMYSVDMFMYVVPAGRLRSHSCCWVSADEYETRAMKMEYWIMNTDNNLWKIIHNGNIKKSLGKDSKGGIIILPPVSFEEHVAVQREIKARTLFCGNEESKKMRKTMLKQAFSEFSVFEEEGLHKGYDRALPPSWSQVALTLKTRGGLEYLSFDDLYNKLRSLEINVKGGSSYGSRSTTIA
nr:hypothetical protein [Tanacetum cinerariifolium]